MHLCEVMDAREDSTCPCCRVQLLPADAVEVPLSGTLCCLMQQAQIPYQLKALGLPIAEQPETWLKAR